MSPRLLSLSFAYTSYCRTHNDFFIYPGAEFLYFVYIRTKKSTDPTNLGWGLGANLSLKKSVWGRWNSPTT